MNPGTGRQAYLDRVRGLAVLVMVEAHVIDSWTRNLDRTRPAFGYALIFGGFGAPLFLLLAGVALVLSAESKYRRSGDFSGAWTAVQARGWQVFGLAFLFRLQSYILTAGYSAASLLRVDILNVMGPAIAFAAMAGRRARTRTGRIALFTVIAAAIAMITPIVRTTQALAWLPGPIEWYLRPVSGRSTFALFPWAGFVFAGAAAGVVIAEARSAGRDGRAQIWLGMIALAVMAASYWLSFRPSIYVRSEFWTSSPTFFFLRVGVVLLLLPLAYLWERAPWRGVFSQWSPLEELGRSSLFVYWIHVEMVYGFLSRPLRRALSLEGAMLATTLFSGFLLLLVILKNHLLASGKLSRVRPSSQTAALSN